MEYKVMSKATGIVNWVRDSKWIEDKLTKAYGRPAAGGVAEIADASQPEIIYNSTGIVLTIDRNRKSEMKAKLVETSKALYSESKATENEDE